VPLVVEVFVHVLRGDLHIDVPCACQVVARRLELGRMVFGAALKPNSSRSQSTQELRATTPSRDTPMIGLSLLDGTPSWLRAPRFRRFCSLCERTLGLMPQTACAALQLPAGRSVSAVNRPGSQGVGLQNLHIAALSSVQRSGLNEAETRLAEPGGKTKLALLASRSFRLDSVALAGRSTELAFCCA
jgi:hypothetical protein